MADDIVIRVRVRDQTTDGIRDAQGRLRDLAGRFAAEGDRAGRGFSRGIDNGLGRTQQRLAAAAGAIAQFGGGAVGIFGVAAAVQQLAGAALVLPGAFSAGIAIVETFKLALTGIGDALGATSSGAGGAGKSMAGFGRQVRDANRAIEDAERGVVDAERQVVGAKRGVQDASKEYQRALADERNALAGIDAARREAIRTLADLAEAQDDSNRSVEGAELALQRAQANLLKVNKDVKATALDRKEAAFSVKEAEDRLSDAQRDATDATTEYDTAQRKGVEGSDQVVAAQQAAADAHDRTEKAAQGVVEANEQLDNAYRGVEDANRGVADAVQRLQDVYAEQKESAAGAAGGADAYATALSKISPEAREVVKVLRGLSDEWRAVQFAVQDAAFEGVAEDISKLAGVYIPLLKTGLSGIAGEFNDMEGFAFDALMDPDVVAAVNDVLGNTAGFLDNAQTSLGDFIAGFLELAGIGSDFLPQMGTWISDIAKDFRDWVEANPEEITQFIQDGLDGFGDLFDIISNVVDIVGAFFDGLAGGADEGGQTFLQMVSDMTGDLKDFMESDGVQGFLGFIGSVISLLMQTLPIWGPIAAGMYLVSVAMGVVNAVMAANPITLIIIGIGLLVAAFIWLWNNVEGFRNFWAGVWDWIKSAFQVTVGGIGDYFTGLWNTISTVAGWISGVVNSMFDGLGAAARWAVNAAITPLNGLIDGLNWTIDGLNYVNPFSPIPHVPNVAYLARGGVASGLAMVGENGPELVDLPAGSRVRTAGDSQRQMAAMAGDQGAAQGPIELRVAPGADSALASLLMRMVRTGELQLVAG